MQLLLKLAQDRMHVRDGHRRNLTSSAYLDEGKFASRDILRDFGRSDFVGVNLRLWARTRARNDVFMLAVLVNHIDVIKLRIEILQHFLKMSWVLHRSWVLYF